MVSPHARKGCLSPVISAFACFANETRSTRELYPPPYSTPPIIVVVVHPEVEFSSPPRYLPPNPPCKHGPYYSMVGR